MKSYNHLWEKLIMDENIETAIKLAAKGKRNKRRIKKHLSDPNLKEKIKFYVENYKNGNHSPITIYDGISRKQRTIIVPTFYELVVQHMIVCVMKPIFMKGMYEHSYGSIPGRGQHKAKKKLCHWIKTGGRNCKYCLKMDIRKFFDSVPNDKLLLKLRNMIHDERFYCLLKKIIETTKQGLPLGFYLSQWLANWYLQSLDHYIKEDLKAVYYIRYMDDMVIFGSNKRILHRIRCSVSDYLLNELGLQLKSNWQVFLFNFKNSKREYGRFLDFMGFKFYRNKCTLRRSIFYRLFRLFTRSLKMIKITIFNTRRILSYFGWIKYTDVKRLFIRKFGWFNFHLLKVRISIYDQRRSLSWQ